MIAVLRQTTSHALMITGCVFMMMVIIEYLNVISRGVWQQGLRGGRWRQYLLAAFLGATPGCLGAFAAVSLYTHGEISLGAVVAAMIATSGDESFVMLSMIPEQSLPVFFLLLVIGLGTGYATDALRIGQKARAPHCHIDFDLHEEATCRCFSKELLAMQWRHCSPYRALLAGLSLFFLVAMTLGLVGPKEWNWIRWTVLLLSLSAMGIVVTVPDHFLEEHLWGHVVKAHVPRIFAWTFGALLLLYLFVDRLHLGGWIHAHQLTVLLTACLVGLIPESGPHILFLTLFVEGTIPFSIFLASSIVQDGHGMLPLLAESGHDFLCIKGINFTVGLTAGLAGYALGW